MEPLNYGHRGTTLKCPQEGGIRYTVSAQPFPVAICHMFESLELLECREALKC